MAPASALNSWAAAFGESEQVSAAMIAARARPAALTATARMIREGRSIAAIGPVGRGARNRTMVQFRPGNAGRYAPAAAGRVGVGGGESAAGGVLRGRLDPGPIGDANQFGERYRAHLLHHPAAVDFDRLFHSAEIGGDNLVELSGDDALEDLALARGERRQPPFDGAPLRARLPHGPVLFDRGAACGEQLPVAERLGDEVHGARFHRPHARRKVALAGGDDDRAPAARCRALLIPL